MRYVNLDTQINILRKKGSDGVIIMKALEIFVKGKFRAGAAGVPGGAVIYWHVDDAAAMMDKLKAMGAREYEPIIRRGDAGFITAAVIDPFGNVLGVMYNPHYVAKRLRVDQQSKTNQQYWLRKR